MLKIAIYGYGKLARGVEKAAQNSSDCTLFGVFTRRDRQAVQRETNAPTYLASDIFSIPENEIDVVILCVGSLDLPTIAPKIAERFCTVDGFDIHAQIPSYWQAIDERTKLHQKTSLVAGGWDPGLFSLARLVLECAMPQGKTYTFWGKGVSQGHTQALKGVDGVLNGVQYTLPKQGIIDEIRLGKTPDLSARDMHERVCYVVAKRGADKEKIKRDIQNMPDYFKGYTTRVHFVSNKTFQREHGSLSHGGKVLRRAKDGHVGEFSLSLLSNPDFTGGALLSCARAVYRLYEKGEFGAKTILDIPPIYFRDEDREEIIQTLL